MGAKDGEGAKSRRGRGTDAVYFDHTTGTECRDSRYHRHCTGRWRGEVSLGYHADGRRNRRKVSGMTSAASSASPGPAAPPGSTRPPKGGPNAGSQVTCAGDRSMAAPRR